MENKRKSKKTQKIGELLYQKPRELEKKGIKQDSIYNACCQFFYFMRITGRKIIRNCE